ncbi:metallophosphoesterase family protein [Chloroflexota bacterium]
MLIGLLSDTHIPDAVMVLPPQLRTAFYGVDIILHAGDIFVASVLDELECIAPVLAAKGDSEYAEVRSDRRVKEKHVLTFEGVTIWLWHDGQRSWNEQGELPDVIVSGHTHWASVSNHGNVLLVNPGSPTYPIYKCRLGTVAVLSVNSGKAEAQIVQLG